MALLDEKQIKKIEAAIKVAEENTSCEIVPVLASSSNQYMHASYLFGFCISLISYLLYIGLAPYIPAEHWHGLTQFQYHLIAIGIMIFTFILGAVTSQYVPALKLPFLSKDEMKLQARRRARQAYFDFCRGRTTGDTGIIIYVSLFEHIVLVLGDNAVAKKIEQAEWDSIKDVMLEHLKKGSLDDAFTDGILKTGNYVKDKMPSSGTNENQLVNEIKFITD